jgi:tetratricopeptide (TPR) repeat protein
MGQGNLVFGRNDSMLLQIVGHCVLVFISSACVMTIELVAGRLVARHLGSSLYTWTSIIGVILAGITIGNYIGGRMADRWNPRKLVAVLFALSSVAAVTIIVLNTLVGKLTLLWYLDWPWRVCTHIGLVFILPSIVLGTISPVVAKWALEHSGSPGRTVGTIYAWSAAGSIVGTFMTGFYLIPAFGTIAIIWYVTGMLALIALILWVKAWYLYAWAIFFGGLAFLGNSSLTWASQTSIALGLREKPDAQILYEAETPYCYVAVKQITQQPDHRLFIQDKLKHSEIIMDSPTDLQYFYTHIYASITKGLRPAADKPISVMVIGGGGYVFPRYIEAEWKGSRIDVVEIDPGVTRAAVEAFGLSPDSTIHSIALDARNYVDEILSNPRKAGEDIRYDFIYEDAINDYSVPYQLVTQEFNDKIIRLLNDDGVYLVNLIDIYHSGQFLGAIVKTLEQTFPHVYVLSENAPRSIRNTFVVAASRKPLDLPSIIGHYTRGSDMWYLNEAEIAYLRTQAGNKILTDDYVPVENLLAPVVRKSSVDFLAGEIRDKAGELKKLGKWQDSIDTYNKLVQIEPTMAILSYNEIAIQLVGHNQLPQAAEYFQKAIAYNETAETKVNIAGIYLNLALIQQQQNQPEAAKANFDRAIAGFQTELAKDPKSETNTLLVANTLQQAGRLNEATDYFLKAVNLNPYNVNNHMALARVLEIQKRWDHAIKGLDTAIEFYRKYNRTAEADQMQKFRDYLAFEKTKDTP